MNEARWDVGLERTGTKVTDPGVRLCGRRAGQSLVPVLKDTAVKVKDLAVTQIARCCQRYVRLVGSLPAFVLRRIKASKRRSLSQNINGVMRYWMAGARA